MRIAVTGGGGFIGAATIAQASLRGHEAWRFDRDDGNDILGDLKDLHGADAVIHLAGLLGTHELFNDLQAAVDVNITGSLRIMDWCVGSGAAYIGITMPDVFPSIYTATKIATVRLANALRHSRGLKVGHVRAFNAYGPGQKYGPGHPQKILPTFAIKAWQGEPLPVWGDGEQGVDLIHVDDIARILLILAEKTVSEELDNATIDAGSGTGISVRALAEHVIKVTGSESTINFLPMRDGEDPTWIFATGEGWGLLDQEEGWRPHLDWTKINDTIEWYRGVA
jgi:UDP-glucose 4-epimerase